MYFKVAHGNVDGLFVINSQFQFFSVLTLTLFPLSLSKEGRSTKTKKIEDQRKGPCTFMTENEAFELIEIYKNIIIGTDAHGYRFQITSSTCW